MGCQAWCPNQGPAPTRQQWAHLGLAVPRGRRTECPGADEGGSLQDEAGLVRQPRRGCLGQGWRVRRPQPRGEARAGRQRRAEWSRVRMGQRRG